MTTTIKVWIVVFVLAVSFFVMDVTGLAQPTPGQRGRSGSFAAQTAVGQTLSLGTGVTNTHTSQLVVTGAPTGCTYRLQGSNDSVTWFDISASDITCTSSTVSHTVDKPSLYVRGNLLTLSGGTAPTVRLHYAGF